MLCNSFIASLWRGISSECRNWPPRAEGRPYAFWTLLPMRASGSSRGFCAGVTPCTPPYKTMEVGSADDSEAAMRKLREIGRDKEGLLKIFTADVLDYCSIVRALNGCSGLFYVFDQARNAAGYHEGMVEIEVRGAHNVLEACAQSPAVEKVVFTSSVAAAVWRRHRNPADDDLIDERFWSDEDFCRKFKLWYALAKTLSEKTAWALAMDRGVKMVAINAALTIGPGFSHQNSGSIVSYLKGAAEMYEDGVLATVDVRFLTTIHICAFEDSLAYGRYICFNQIVNTAEHAINLARNLRPLLSLPDKCDDSRVYPQRLTNKKLDRLKIHIECNYTTISSDIL